MEMYRQRRYKCDKKKIGERTSGEISIAPCSRSCCFKNGRGQRGDMWLHLSNLGNLNRPCIYSMHPDNFVYLLQPYANDSRISVKMHERPAIARDIANILQRHDKANRTKPTHTKIEATSFRHHFSICSLFSELD